MVRCFTWWCIGEEVSNRYGRFFATIEQDDLYINLSNMMASFRHTVGLILISVFFSVNSELGMKHFYRVENITMKKLAILLEKHEVPGVQYCSVFAHPVLCTLSCSDF
jgi:hypothetical protein